MSIELKDGANFPPEERDFDKILLQLGREVEKGDYQDSDLLCFIKTGEGLYSFEDETRGIDDANFMGMSEMRLGVIKKYIQTIAFLWQDKDSDEIELHIEHTFDDIRGIDIQAEIETGRNQELAELGKAAKEVVFDLVDSKSLLKNTEVLEFGTTEEVFFFVLNLLGLEKIAAYLNGEGPRVVNLTTRRGDLDNIALITNFIAEQNNANSDIIMKLYDMGLPMDKTPGSYASLSSVCRDTGLSLENLNKIKLKQS